MICIHTTLMYKVYKNCIINAMNIYALSIYIFIVTLPKRGLR